jgi:hypothetical protein
MKYLNVLCVWVLWIISSIFVNWVFGIPEFIRDPRLSDLLGFGLLVVYLGKDPLFPEGGK